MLVFRSGDRVSDVIAKAGGVIISSGIPDNILEIGDLSAIRLYRADGTELLVNLESRVAGAGDPELLPGDSIVVPRREQTYYALGRVSRAARAPARFTGVRPRCRKRTTTVDAPP